MSPTPPAKRAVTISGMVDNSANAAAAKLTNLDAATLTFSTPPPASVDQGATSDPFTGQCEAAMDGSK